MNKTTDELETFVTDLTTYREVAAKWHGNCWLYSLRRLMRLDRAEFEELALAAHRADLIELRRCDLTDAVLGTDHERFLLESAVVVPGTSYTFHFLA